MKNLVLDVNIILDLWLRRVSDEQLLLIAEFVVKREDKQYHTWLSNSSLSTLEYVTRRELKKGGMDGEAASQATRALLAHLLENVQLLSQFGFHQDAALQLSNDLEDAQIVMAASQLKGSTALVTNDKRFQTDGKIEQVSLLEVSAWLDREDKRPIEFVDLKMQQDTIRPQLEQRIHRVLHHGTYIMGPEIKELEKKLADYVGVQHAITVASGTDSLEIALRALNIGPGDEVITVPFTWISTAEVICQVGARPVFIDIEPATFNMNVDLLEAAITPRTKAILPVSLFGQMPDYTRINEIAARHGNIPVIEDGAQSFGATQHGRRSCGVTLIGSTSFFPAKPFGCYGDGGALFTNDDHLADTMRAIRTHGGLIRHHHPLIGMNGRLDTLQAAILLAKFDHFDWEVQRRGEIGARYTELIEAAFPPSSLSPELSPKSSSLSPQLSPESSVLSPNLSPEPSVLSPNPSSVLAPRVASGNTSVYAQYTIRVQDREALVAKLKASGIPCAIYYPKCLHEQPAFAFCGYQWGDFPEAEKASREVLSLPMHPYLGEVEQEQIVAAVGIILSQMK